MFDQANHPSSTPREELSPICTVTNEREGVCVVGKVGQTERVGGKGWCSSFDSSLSYSNTGWESSCSSSWREDLSPGLNKDYVGRIFSLKDRAENPFGVTVDLQMTSSAKTGPRHTVIILSLVATTLATMRNVRSWWTSFSSDEPWRWCVCVVWGCAPRARLCFCEFFFVSNTVTLPSTVHETRLFSQASAARH